MPQTQVAGTIGGVNQGSGVYGALPGVKVLPVKVLSDDGYGSMSDIMVSNEVCPCHPGYTVTRDNTQVTL